MTRLIPHIFAVSFAVGCARTEQAATDHALACSWSMLAIKHGTTETWLVVNWGAVRRQEAEPATCGDPNCDADHGYTIQDLADDLTVRISAAADGEDAVSGLVRFAARLQRVAV